MRALTLLLLTGGLGAALPAQALERLEVLPTELRLRGARDRARVVVLGVLEDGAVLDLTSEARLVAADVDVVHIDGTDLRAAGDGRTAVTVEARGRQAVLAATVEGATSPDPIRFETETLAVLTRQGCNAGACHGSPSGRGGFFLSLFAFDPAQDLRVLTRDMLARRTNVLEPDESLLLKKPLLRAPHVGGKRLRVDGEPFAILRQWIAEGCEARPDSAVQVVDLAVEPARARRRLEDGRGQQLRVTATFSDGSVRDVSHLAAFGSTRTAIAGVDEHGRVTAEGAGDATVMVRYLDRIATARLTFTEHVDGFSWPDVPERNLVDHLVNARLREREIAPAGTCSDQAFVRRLWLDVTGLLPPVDEVEAFVSDAATDKRDVLIDRLLASDQHARFWARKLADLLKVTKETLKDRAPEYAAWIEGAYRSNLPHDDLVRELLTGTGAPSLYYAATPTATDLVETTTQVFLGSRLNCAKCHNHPFESWTQDDYYRIAAAFVPGTQHPRREREMTPWPLTRDEPVPPGPQARRAVFAAWLTSPDNPWFARVTVNRIWAEVFGRGIVEPVDDFRASNPPSNPELLDALAAELVSGGFDRRRVLRLILRSATWQREAAAADPRDTDPGLFGHRRPRLLTAEQVHDAVLRVTSEPARAVALDAVARAEAYLSTIEQQLDAERPQWIEQRRAAIASGARPAASAWWVCAPFAGGFGVDHAPEHGVDLEHSDGELTWTARPGWTDGTVWPLDLPANASAYLYRTLDVPTDTKVTVRLGSDDGLKLLVNGETVLTRDVARGVAKDQDRVEVALRGGRNEILLRVHNRGGAAGFFFRAESELLDAGFVALLATPEERWTDAQRAEIARIHAAGSATLAAVQRTLTDVRRVADDWFATQSALPGGEPSRPERALLDVFGAPPRTSPCACDRVDEPTLQQALQVLNGPFVAERLRDTATLVDLDDDALIGRLWLAALARRPADDERERARAFLAGVEDRGAAVQDLVWAVLAKKEFLFQR